MGSDRPAQYAVAIEHLWQCRCVRCASCPCEYGAQIADRVRPFGRKHAILKFGIVSEMPGQTIEGDGKRNIVQHDGSAMLQDLMVHESLIVARLKLENPIAKTGLAGIEIADVPEVDSG